MHPCCHQLSTSAAPAARLLVTALLCQCVGLPLQRTSVSKSPQRMNNTHLKRAAPTSITMWRAGRPSQSTPCARGMACISMGRLSPCQRTLPAEAVAPSM